jgi:hypothetical protein
MSIPTKFTNLDFNSLRTQIKDYLRSNSNFTDFDFEGSNFSVLVDILAYNSYITAFNTNMAVNEAFLDSATLRENVISLAKNIGYVPKSRRAARAKISFTVASTTARTITLKAGLVVLGAVQGGRYIFSIPEDITVPVDNDRIATFSEVSVYEGNFLKKSFVVDYNSIDQKFILPNGGIDTDLIRVIVSGTADEEYEQFKNIHTANSNTKFFLVQEVKDEKYEIFFGDNIIGKRPPNGSTVNVSYIVSNGLAGNGAANFTFSGILEDNNFNSITTGISLIQTIIPSENGDEIESIESVKYLSPRVYASQYRAVTANDYVGLLPFLFPNIESVSAYGGDELDPPEYGTVYISAKPRNGSYLSRVTKLDILSKLKQYSVSGLKIVLKDLKYLFIEIDSTVYYNKSITSNPDQLKTDVINTITKYGKNSELNSFGGRFKYSKLVSLIDNTRSSITSNITKVRIRRDLLPELNKLATYEICFGNKFHIKKEVEQAGFNIKSSGFTIDGVSGTLYLSDVPISNEIGTIFYFKIENNFAVVVKQNAGTVDYTKGEIMLDPTVFTSTVKANGIEIQAIPDSNDIVGLKDLYLELSIQNSVVNILEDNISSGENTSATNYVSTSSYLNGNLTR